MIIEKLIAREILDSRGSPTLEIDCEVSDSGRSGFGRSSVPSGASTGSSEAVEKRDHDLNWYAGRGVQKVVEFVNAHFSKTLQAASFENQKELDNFLIQQDGTEQKKKLGSNLILGISQSFFKATAALQKLPLVEHFAQSFPIKPMSLPVPMMNFLNGGKHSNNGLQIQEFMVIPHGFEKFSHALEAGVKVFQSLKKILNDAHLSTAVGDEGGFAPQLNSKFPHEQALVLLMNAIEQTGLSPGEQVSLAIDVAATEFYDPNSDLYHFEGNKIKGTDLITIYRQWCSRYPLISIEDGLSERDFEHWRLLTEQSKNIQIVGDDLFVTQVKYIKRGLEEKSANAVLIKPNQVGTLTETMEALKMALDAGWGAICSHRSGETEDSLLADLAVGSGCGQIKTGAVCRGERIAKYNQLLRIEQSLGNSVKLAKLR